MPKEGRMKELEATWSRVLEVWWSLVWRGVTVGIVAGIAADFVLEFVGAPSSQQRITESGKSPAIEMRDNETVNHAAARLTAPKRCESPNNRFGLLL